MHPKEIEARNAKAAKLIAVLISLGGTAESAAKLSRDEWKKVAQVAKVPMPSETTVALVVQRLGEIERSAAQMAARKAVLA